MSTQRSDAPPPRWRGVHKALADPLRIRLLEALWETPQSARELADRADLPADRLYYHLGQLERAGLIEIAEYRPLARGKVERVYAPAVTEPPVMPRARKRWPSSLARCWTPLGPTSAPPTGPSRPVVAERSMFTVVRCG